MLCCRVAFGIYCVGGVCMVTQTSTRWYIASFPFGSRVENSESMAAHVCKVFKVRWKL